jgi:hypothetical protein
VPDVRADVVRAELGCVNDDGAVDGVDGFVGFVGQRRDRERVYRIEDGDGIEQVVDGDDFDDDVFWACACVHERSKSSVWTNTVLVMAAWAWPRGNCHEFCRNFAVGTCWRNNKTGIRMVGKIPVAVRFYRLFKRQ